MSEESVSAVTMIETDADKTATKLVRTSSRELRFTEKGLEYQLSVRGNQFREHVSKWRSSVSKMSRLLSDETDVSIMRINRDSLEERMYEVLAAFDRLKDLLSEDAPQLSGFAEILASVEEENQKFMCKIGDRISEIQQENSETMSRTSSRSRRSSKSGRSKISNRSQHSDVAAEAAALKAKLKYIDAEARSKAELEKITTMRKLEMAQAKLGALEEDICRPSANFHLEMPERVDKAEYTKEYVQSLVNVPQMETIRPMEVLQPSSYVEFKGPVPSLMNPDAKEYIPTMPQQGNVREPPMLTETLVAKETPEPGCPKSDLVENETCAKDSQRELLELTKTLAEQACLSRFPPPEPSVFDGDPLKYPVWKAAFHTLIEQKRIPSSEKIHYLRKYLSGSVREVVENFFLLTSEDAYDEAKKLLEERYGDPFIIGSAFRDRLEKWPKIQAKDSFGLRRFSDFLKQCLTAMSSVKGLSVLNDDRENRKMLMIVPEWLVNRWNRFVSQWKEKTQEFPPFKEFVCFVEKEAKIACDPVTSLHSLKQDPGQNNTGKVFGRPPLKGRTLLTETHASSGLATGPKEEKRKCTLCQKTNHDLNKCFQFLAKPLEERKVFARQKQLCFGCLGTGHISKKCKQRKRCEKCNKQHPTSLHGDNSRPDSESTAAKEIHGEASSDKHASVLCGVAIPNSVSSCLMSSMILPVYLSHESAPESERLVYALLDSQSDTSFILEDTCTSMGLDGTKVNLMLSTMHAENKRVKSSKIKGLSVRGFNSPMKIQMPVMYSRQIMPANRLHIPTPETARRLPHLSSIADELLPLQNCEIGLLIGYNCARALTPRDVIAPDDEGPYAQRTDLGWGIVGIVEGGDVDDIGYSHNIMTYQVPSRLNRNSNCPDKVLVSLQTKVKEVIKPCDISRMMELEFSEDKFERTHLSFEDIKFMDIMKEGIHEKDGHYEMPLPFKQERPLLQNNKSVALQRLRHLCKKLEADGKYRDHYFAFMKDIIAKGHAEKVPDSELDEDCVWYLPHHGVYHPKKRDKIRVVFDCSARFNGTSLNDHLLQGPDLTNTLVGVLNRFRKEPVAFICDIEQMFHQFRVVLKDRNYLRFLWWEDGEIDKEPEEFRMCVHLFGAVSSPGCANYALKQVATDNETVFGSAVADFIRRDFYVDDGLKSVPTAEDAIELIDKSRKMCSKGGINLHKFLSNSKEVLDHIPMEDLAKGIKDLDLVNDTLPVERALGIQWCTETDTFQFNPSLMERPLTRRGILSTLNSVYDPLGFLAPVLLTGKQILQQMCKEKADWDDPLPDVLKVKWQNWILDLLKLEKLKIQRCVKPVDFGDVQTVELHHFSDASTTGYGQCSYLRLFNDRGDVHCTLLMGKARVTPLKQVTIPRLELVAALLSVKISALLRKELEYESITEYFWTDSSIVLSYISNDARRFHVFVANRVQQIRNHCEPAQWRHVVSSENPADMASRGVSVQELVENPSWLSGPDFLWRNTDIQNKEHCIKVLPENDPELKRVQAFQTKAEEQSSILENLEYFSDWQRAKGAIARCLKLKNKLLKRSREDDTPSRCIKVDNLQKAEKEIIKHLQRVHFEEELYILDQRKSEQLENASSVSKNKALKRNSPLYKLDPFLDNDGVLRVGGRLRLSNFPSDVKHPVILPRKSHVTELIIKHFHEACEHQGRGLTLNTIRSNGFWIIGCSSAVAFWISKCVHCRRLRSAVQGQKMSDLPQDRLEATSPFVYSAVDYFGPWVIKEGRKEVKRYGVLFTCLCCRAVHLETANSLDTDSFINALRRFLSIRGPIRQLRSDQGTNFVGAAREFREGIGSLDVSRITQYLQKQGCDFEFKMNVPSASHMGGVWERQIRSVRSVLNTLLDQCGSQLDDESLRTFTCEAAAIINSRPLTVENLNDPLSPEPLTPNHLLTLKSKILLPPPGEFQRPDLYSRKRWRRVQYLANEFWTRWNKEYLQNLQTRNKWSNTSRNIDVGDIVLIRDDNTPRNEWQMGRVVETYPDDDKLVRKVNLQVGSTSLNNDGKRTESMRYLERPIHKLVLLVESQNTG